MAINLNGTTGITTTGLTSNGIDDNATSTAMTLDTSGNVLVGKTLSSGSTQGVQLQAAGNVFATASNDYPLYLNRLGSDGQLAQFRKDGTQVGSIGAKDGDLTIGTGDTGLYFSDGADAVYPYNTSTQSDRDNAVDLGYPTVRFKDLYLSGSAYTPVVQGLGDEAGLTFGGALVAPRKNNAAANGTVDLGASSARFKDFYLSGGVYLGGTGSANKLDDYEEGTWTVSVSSGTVVNTHQATYTKIGNVVHCQLKLNTFSDTSSGNAVQINLPFAYFSNDRSTIGMNVLSTEVSGINDMNGYLESGNLLRFYSSVTGVSGYDYLKHSDLGSGAGMYVGFSYFSA